MPVSTQGMSCCRQRSAGKIYWPWLSPSAAASPSSCGRRAAHPRAICAPLAPQVGHLSDISGTIGPRRLAAVTVEGLAPLLEGQIGASTPIVNRPGGARQDRGAEGGRGALWHRPCGTAPAAACVCSV